MPAHLLLIDCPDERGLVHRISGVLSRYEFNITSNHEFVDTTRNHFLMRTAFTGGNDARSAIAELQKSLPAGAHVRLASDQKRPVVIIVTKEAHCLGDLLLLAAWGDYPAEIKAVIGNHALLGPLVDKFGIPFHHIPHEGLGRPEHEEAIQAAIAPYRPDYLVLAKYMRVLSPAFIAKWQRQIINIHHSFLPAFIGANPYRQAYERGVKIIGATAHFVTDDLDEGPIIAQNVVPVSHAHSASEMAQAGQDVEKIVLAKALRLVLEERVFQHGNRTVVFE